MNKVIYTLLITISFFQAIAGVASAIEGDTLIRNVNIIATQTMTITPNVDVLITGERISKIGHKLKATSNNIIDGSNRYLAPGLIDSHTHLDGVPGMTYKQMQNNRKLVSRAQEQIPRSYLYHGFTTVIDLHSDAENIERWNKQDLRPEAYFCGAAPIIDGYPMSFIPKPFRYRVTPYFVVEEGRQSAELDLAAHTPKAVVASMLRRGAVCVKTHYETGFAGQADLPVPSVTLIKQLVSEAHAQGLKVVLHANSQKAQNFGLLTGVDAFVHGMWTWDDQHLNTGVKETISAAIKNGLSLQPTFQVLYGERDLHNPEYLQATELSKVLPHQLIEWYASGEGQSFRTEKTSQPYIQQNLADHGWSSIDAAPIERLELYFSQWLKQSGKLLFGSDTPSDQTFANPPGLNGRTEMMRWQQAGVTATQFLSAATIENARFFNLGHEIGSIDEGKRADLLLLSENPLNSIEAFDHIEKVFIKGRMMGRNSLAAPNRVMN